MGRYLMLDVEALIESESKVLFVSEGNLQRLLIWLSSLPEALSKPSANKGIIKKNVRTDRNR